jgi:Tfp pilus assembly protein PilO
MPVNFSTNISMGGQPLSKSSRNSMFEVGLLLIICLLFSWFILLPKRAEVAQKQSNLETVKKQGDNTSKQLATLQSLVNSLPSDSQNIAELDQALPLDGSTIRLQLLIQNLAQSVGVTVGNISVSGNPSGEVSGNTALLANPYGASRTVQTMDGTLDVVGSFQQLQSLLQKLENSGRLIDMDSMTINQGSSPGNLDMNLTFKAYYFAP